MNKIIVGIIYGGRSVEHEVSLRSSASVFNRLDRARFEPKLIYIDPAGAFHWVTITDELNKLSSSTLPKAIESPEVVLLPHPHKVNGSAKAVFAYQNSNLAGKTEMVDLVMPLVHGTNCEDGTLQGLFESAEIPFTGGGVLSSALCMDKDVAKRLCELAQIPIVPYFVSYSWDTPAKQAELLKQVETSFGFPVFIKAAGQGSSLGVFKAKTKDQFLNLLKEAYRYDTKVLIEKAIPAREIEFSVLENPDRSLAPLVSVPAEIIPNQEFYTYDAKYHDDNGATFKIPAEITPEQRANLTQLVQKIFTCLECEGYARVDLFMDRENGAFYFNEVNTLPGFTSISMFPKLWEVSGVGYTELLTKLVELSLLRYKRRSVLLREKPLDA
jgi:D-alanine-D-alanine ligase